MRIGDEMLDQDGRIDPARWHTALTEHGFVGRCAECGGACQAVKGSAAWGKRFYSAECLMCGEEAVIPERRIVRTPKVLLGVGSSLHDPVLLEASRERDAAILGETA